MARIMLDGLNRYRSRGKWYVYHRASGTALVRGFTGSSGDLLKHLSSPAVLSEFARLGKGREAVSGTFGALAQWYQETRHFKELAPRTQSDYRRVLTFLERVELYPISDIATSDVADMRDRGADKHGARFGAYVVQVMSAIFREAIERGKMKNNPARGVRLEYKSRDDANRRWNEDELSDIFGRLPPRLLVPMSLARWGGMREGDIVQAKRSIVERYAHGRALSYVTRKGGNLAWCPIEPELWEVIGSLDHDSLFICINSLGRPWASENALRVAWGGWKVKNGAPLDLTLHGLRTTFSCNMRERGATDKEIAAMIGDKSPSMGAHYSRHAEMRGNIVKLFENTSTG